MSIKSIIYYYIDRITFDITNMVLDKYKVVGYRRNDLQTIQVGSKMSDL